MKHVLTMLALVAALGAGVLAAGCSDMSGGGSPSTSAKPAGGGY